MASTGLDTAQAAPPTITDPTSATVAYILHDATGLVTLSATPPGAVWSVTHHQPAGG